MPFNPSKLPVSQSQRGAHCVSNFHSATTATSLQCIAVHCHQHQYNTDTNTATSTNTASTPTLPPAPMVGSGLHWCKICTRLGHNLIHHSQLTRWQCTARQLLPSIDFTAPGAIQSPVNRRGAGGGGGGGGRSALWHKSQVAAKPVHKIRTWIILAATTTISPWDFI